MTPAIAQTSLLQKSQTCRDVCSNAKSRQRGQQALTRSGRTITTTNDDRRSKPDWRQRGCFCQQVQLSFTSQLIIQTQVHRTTRSRLRCRRPSTKPSCFCQDVSPGFVQSLLLQKSQTCRGVRSNAKSRERRHKHRRSPKRRSQRRVTIEEASHNGGNAVASARK